VVELGVVLAAVHVIQDRHVATHEVERNFMELHQGFLDMTLLPFFLSP
jgi:syntaxin 1B/2/3